MYRVVTKSWRLVYYKNKPYENYEGAAHKKVNYIYFFYFLSFIAIMLQF